MTVGDHMLMRAIDRALVAHPFVCPLPITLGGGGHDTSFARGRAVARHTVAADGARPARGGATPRGIGGREMSAREEKQMDAIAEAVAAGATLPAAYRKAGVSAIGGMALWARICARLGVPVAGDAK